MSPASTLRSFQDERAYPQIFRIHRQAHALCDANLFRHCHRRESGLVVENTYVASQEFNRKAEEGREQAALGWTGTLTIAGGAVHYSLSDASGGLLALRSVTATFRHPAYEQEDRVISLARMADGTFGSKKTVVDGVWIVEIDADVGRQKPYRQVRRVVVADGAIR
jgi:nitrogen fixation protein FixH